MAVLLPYVRYLLPLLPFTMLIISTIYGVPSDLFFCGLESHWSHLFRAKDDQAIRTIENSLRCCGLNSLHDRAWPFPSQNHQVDVRACERTLGYTSRCADPWRRQQQIAAGMIVLASLFNWILLQVVDMVAQSNRHGLQFGPAPDARFERARLLRAEEGDEHGGSGIVQGSYAGAD